MCLSLLFSCELFISLESKAKMKIETTQDLINMTERMHCSLSELIFDVLLKRCEGMFVRSLFLIEEMHIHFLSNVRYIEV